ncbi:MAG: NAD-dependent epimerase/dehydratase family protein [Candidatus Dormibacteraceae bacterium]
MNNWWTGKRVTVTGGHGFLGKRVVELLKKSAPADVATCSSSDYDLTKQQHVAQMYAELRPDVVIHLAARVGGIGANRENPGRFFYDNAIMGIEVMEQARRNNVRKFVAVGTVCE